MAPISCEDQTLVKAKSILKNEKHKSHCEQKTEICGRPAVLAFHMVSRNVVKTFCTNTKKLLKPNSPTHLLCV